MKNDTYFAHPTKLKQTMRVKQSLNLLKFLHFVLDSNSSHKCIVISYKTSLNGPYHWNKRLNDHFWLSASNCIVEIFRLGCVANFHIWKSRTSTYSKVEKMWSHYTGRGEEYTLDENFRSEIRPLGAFFMLMVLITSLITFQASLVHHPKEIF